MLKYKKLWFMAYMYKRGVNMRNTNDQFLEEYKHLDKICREMYRTEKGVTAYIDDMKRVPPYETRAIINWDTDLRQLVRLRHMRNRLTHECGTLDQEMCTQSEIEWIQDFYGRILLQSDPIALLAKRQRTLQPKPKELKQQPEFPSSAGWKDYREQEGSPMDVILFLLFGAFFFVIISLLIRP